MRKIPEDTVVSLFKLRFSIENIFFRDYMKHYNFPDGINHTHMKTLLILRNWGEQSMSDLSKKLNLEKGSFTPIADKLIKTGYIFKERSQTDKRVYTLHLSDLGRETATKFKSEHLIYIQKYLEQLSEEEKIELDEATVNVIKILEHFEDEKNKIRED